MIDNYISVEVKKKLKYFGFTIYYSNRLQKVILYHTKEDYQFCATKNDFIQSMTESSTFDSIQQLFFKKIIYV
jgi:hypothetical protein